MNLIFYLSFVIKLIHLIAEILLNFYVLLLLASNDYLPLGPLPFFDYFDPDLGDMCRSSADFMPVFRNCYLL